MGVLKKITGEYFDDLTREESKIKTNIKKIDFVDIGCSVLWADTDLKIYSHPENDIESDSEFSFDVLYDMNFKNGMRLPTVEEFKELENVNRKQQNTTFVFSNDGFDDKLYFFAEEINNRIKILHITSQTEKDFVYGVELDGLFFGKDKKININKYYKKGNFLFKARLVKDK